jgi:hypothetical protein
MVDHIPPKPPLQTIAWIVVFLLSISMAISACVGVYQEFMEMRSWWSR